MSESAGPIAADVWAMEVIERNGADLLKYLARRLREPADAADVLSNVLVVIWQRRTALPGGAESARMWSYGVARNALREHHRRSVRRTALADALRSRIRDDLSSHGDRDDPLQAVARAERSDDVRLALATLREHDRELIMLVHWDGLTLSQAASLLGINPSTARTRYARAKERLATTLAEHRQAADLRPHGRTTKFHQRLEDEPETSS